MITFSIIQKSQLEGALRLDAEYYQLEFLKLITNLENLKAIFLRELATNPKRNFKPVKGKKFEYIEISGVNLESGEYDTNCILGENTPDRAQWIIKKNDVIISTVRPIRNAISLISDEKDTLVCSSGFAVLRAEKIYPEYLFVYFKTKPIVKLLDRLTTATLYPAITVDDILNMKICLGEKSFRESIKLKVVELKNELIKSKELYAQAENLLLEELGLKNFEEDKSLFSVVNLLEVENANRMDAEYFQKKYKKLVKSIKLNNAKKLGDLVSIKKGFEPGAEEYKEEGKLFIRVSTLSKNGINLTEEKYLSEKLYQELKKYYEPEVGEILLTKDATPGIAYAVKEPVEGIMSGGILRLKIKENIDAEYLTLCLNSIVGQMQAERDSGGSVIAHWRPEQIKNILIPVLPKEIQKKISDLVHKSHEARKKAKELLEEAKLKVEEMIENKK